MFYKGLFKYFIDEMFGLISGEKPVPRDRREEMETFEKYMKPWASSYYESYGK